MSETGSVFEYADGMFDRDGLALLRAVIAATDADESGWASASELAAVPGQGRNVRLLALRLKRLAERGVLERARDRRTRVWLYRPTALGRRQALIELPAARPVGDAIRRMIARD